LEERFIIAGLGNPGSKYANTRHNVGFMTLDLISVQSKIKITKVKHKALIGEGTFLGRKIVLVKPQTFMNLCGECIREILEWYKTPPENIIIVYDDIDLPPGKIRIRPEGSSGTHNGMKSVIYQIQSDKFPRIRIGTGKPPEGWDLADYVLGRFSPDEMELVKSSIARAAEAAVDIIEAGVEHAMNKFNG
jgi:peptidyl-tRNA hydrolase, PTH1 family